MRRTKTRVKGEEILRSHLVQFENDPAYGNILETLKRIETGERDLRL
jgi:hypothetical protein